MGDEYGIYYQPEVVARRVNAARLRLIFRLVFLLLPVAVYGVLWMLWPTTFGSLAPWFIGFTVLSGGGMGVVNLIQYLRIRGDARKAAGGLAIGLNRDGLLIGQRWLTWPEVGSMVVKPARLGASAALITTARDLSTSSVPLELTDAMPASVDSVVRVLSGGLAWVDLSRLD